MRIHHEEIEVLNMVEEARAVIPAPVKLVLISGMGIRSAFIAETGRLVRHAGGAHTTSPGRPSCLLKRGPQPKATTTVTSCLDAPGLEYHEG